jgi:ankyrin repeat protein
LTYTLSTHFTHDEGNAALHAAVRGGEIEALEAFIDAGADINSFNDEPKTPYREAVSSGSVTPSEFLLTKGASVSIDR